MHKREDGFVVVDEEVCIGCRYCSMACPYGAPQFDEVKGHMTKCDGCYERVAEGKNLSALSLVHYEHWIWRLLKSYVKNMGL